MRQAFKGLATSKNQERKLSSTSARSSTEMAVQCLRLHAKLRTEGIGNALQSSRFIAFAVVKCQVRGRDKNRNNFNFRGVGIISTATAIMPGVQI